MSFFRCFENRTGRISNQDITTFQHNLIFIPFHINLISRYFLTDRVADFGKFSSQPFSLSAKIGSVGCQKKNYVRPKFGQFFSKHRPLLVRGRAIDDSRVGIAAEGPAHR